MDEQTVMLYGFVLYHLAVATVGEESVIMLTSHFEIVHQLARRRRKAQAARSMTPHRR